MKKINRGVYMRFFLYKVFVLFVSTILYSEACDRLIQGSNDTNTTNGCNLPLTIMLPLCNTRVAQGCSDCGACDSVDEGSSVLWSLPAPLSCDSIEKPYLKQGENICVSSLTPLPQEAIDVQDRHNQLRAEVYSGGEIAWSVEVAASAQACVDSLAQSGEFAHCASGYGENLYASTRDDTYIDAINRWAEEKPYYHYATNSCDDGQTCGHYTQIIWKDSIEVGCGKAQFTTGQYQGWYVIACQYNPPGNYIGQKPY